MQAWDTGCLIIVGVKNAHTGLCLALQPTSSFGPVKGAKSIISVRQSAEVPDHRAQY